MLEWPTVILAFVMLGLFVLEWAVELSPEWSRIVSLVQWLIWLVFVLQFVVELAIADDKHRFLRRNWFMVLTTLLPFLRVFRAFGALRAARSIPVLRSAVLSSQSLQELSILFQRRRIQYLLLIVVVVTFLGAAVIYTMEQNVPGANIVTFGDALWWSAGIVTTVGTEMNPVTAEGRVVAVIMMAFGVSVFGYVAGALASMFVRSDQQAAGTAGRDITRRADGQ